MKKKRGKFKVATSIDFIEYVCDQVSSAGQVRYKKLFGEFIVYINGRPVFTVCDNTVYVKKIPEMSELLNGAQLGCPYDGAKVHYILDIDNAELALAAADILKEVIPLPKPRKKKV